MKIRKEKIGFFEERIADFYEKAGREHLPWRPRKTSSRGKVKQITAYEVWVSEIMLQQTQVSRVIGYYEKFLGRFPTVESLARASWEEFLPYYAGLGYYARGRNMLRAAKVVVEEHRGKFPRDRKLLEKIPGVGPYTAAAIMSFAYGDEHLAWDTNLKRVIGRFFYGSKYLITDEGEWEERLKTKRKTLNAALMDFGSALCVARPKCGACPLRLRCVYHKEGGASELTKIHTSKIIHHTSSVNWSTAQVYVFLHENHKKYYSAAEKTYQPFVLSKGYNTRAGIKKYFKEQYGLDLAVRPPHERVVVKGKPTIFVNAQILLGEPAFMVFPKKSFAEYNKNSFDSL